MDQIGNDEVVKKKKMKNSSASSSHLHKTTRKGVDIDFIYIFGFWLVRQMNTDDHLQTKFNNSGRSLFSSGQKKSEIAF